MELEELYQEVILDHSRKPRNYGELPDATARVHGDNPMCGDEVTVFLEMKDGTRVDNLKFTGNGCSICMASASLMTLKLKNKSREESSRLANTFTSLFTSEEEPVPDPALGDLRLLAGVRQFPQRVKCATLAWHAFLEALDQPAGKTESSFSVDPE